MTFNNYWRLIVKNKTTTKNKQTTYKAKIVPINYNEKLLEYGTLRTLDYVIVIISLPVCDDPYLSHVFVLFS